MHLFYFQAWVEQSDLFISFHLSVLTTMQIIAMSYRITWRFAKPMYPSWVPWNTRPACTLGTSKTNPLPSYHGVQAPVQTWTPSPHSWVPNSVRCLDLHHPRLQSIGLERARTHEKRAMSLPAPISKYVLRIISLWPIYHHNNGRSLTDTDRENSVTKPCPVGYGTQPITPTNTLTISLPALLFPFTNLSWE
jgi:hypothetical protein